MLSEFVGKNTGFNRKELRFVKVNRIIQFTPNSLSLCDFYILDTLTERVDSKSNLKNIYKALFRQDCSKRSCVTIADWGVNPKWLE